MTEHGRLPSAWLLMAVGYDRQHGGNAGYVDDPATMYAWDSTVPHHADLAVGDRIVLWDKRASLGVSAIERIDRGSEVKILRKCPSCHKAGIKARKTKTPQYKCYKCGEEFDRAE